MNQKEMNKKIRAVYSKMYKIIALYEKTNHYNDSPKEGMDIEEHMDARFADIRELVDQSFWENHNTAAKLHRVVDELEYFVKQYEVPGVVLRWKSLNHTLMYFEPAFDMMEENMELYLEMKHGMKYPISFSFYPNEEMILERKKYFARGGTFQRELQHTLRIVMKHDFEDVFVVHGGNI